MLISRTGDDVELFDEPGRGHQDRDELRIHITLLVLLFYVDQPRGYGEKEKAPYSSVWLKYTFRVGLVVAVCKTRRPKTAAIVLAGSRPCAPSLKDNPVAWALPVSYIT